MKTYIVKRVLSAVPLLVCISFLCFVFINMIPSDPAEVALRVRQTPIISEEAIEQVREELGLNDPYLVRYGRWVMDCLRLDFGVSYTNPSRTVLGEIERCLPATAVLAFTSLVFVILLSLPIGFFCAVYKNSWFDLHIHVHPAHTQQHAGEYEGGLCALCQCQGAAPKIHPGETHPEKLSPHLYCGYWHEYPPADGGDHCGGKRICLAGSWQAMH